MKNILLLSLIFLFPVMTFAATKTATPSSTVKPQSKIDDLKERLATKVAELRKSSPKAVSGTVTQKSISSMTVDTVEKALKIELTDDIKVAQIIRGKRTVLSIEDIDKDDIVTVFGDYDETLDLLRAKKVFIESKITPVRLNGSITAIDKKTNSFTFKGVDETSYTIDVEATTKNNTWTKVGGVEKSGFSKLEIGNFATIVGTVNAKESDRYSALRILVVKTGDAVLGTPSTAPTAAVTASPSPKSSIKPTATGKATPKTTPTPTKNVTPTP